MSATRTELDPVEVLAEEFAERYRKGERPSLTEYADKHPELAEQIRELFPALVLMEEFGSVVGSAAGPGAAALTQGTRAPAQLGDYRILREVGRGGMGIVFEAVQESLGRHVALKVLPSHGLMAPSHLERFRREAKAAARLHHTNIVPVFGVGEDRGVHYYAMQFIQGQSLDEVLNEVRWLRRRKQGSDDRAEREPAPSQGGRHAALSLSIAGGLITGHFPGGLEDKPPQAPAAGRVGNPSDHLANPASDARRTSNPSCDAGEHAELSSQSEAQYCRSVAQTGAQVADALEYAHRQGILHRDIKPSNLLLDVRGTVWVSDFGLAKAGDSEDLTHTGDIVGTLRYMAPERFHGRSDPRSDVYGLGAALYELLVLRPAFDSSSRPGLIEQVLHTDPPRPRNLDPHIPLDLETIVLKAIDKEPGRRYQTAADMAEDLHRFLVDRPIRARRIGPRERAVKWARRRPAAAALLGVSAVALTALIVGGLAYNARLAKINFRLQKAVAEAEANLIRAKEAERDKTEQLAVSHFKEAQAKRWSGRAGRRFDSLEALQKSADSYRSLGQLDEEKQLLLRNEAIACLALADMRIADHWKLDAREGTALTAAFDGNLERYATHDGAGAIYIRRTADHRELCRLPGPGRYLRWTLCFSPNGQLVAAKYDPADNDVRVWDLDRREVVFKVPVPVAKNSLVFSPDGHSIFVVATDGGIHAYDVQSGDELKHIRADLKPDSIAFRPDWGQIAVSGLSEPIVQVRDLDSGNLDATLEHPAQVGVLTWSPDGRSLAVGGADGRVYLWDTLTWQRRAVLTHGRVLDRLIFSRSGELLVSGAWDRITRLWDVRSGQELVNIPGEPLRTAQFGADDRLLPFKASNRQVGIWETAAGSECRTIHGVGASAAISPDGRLIACSAPDGTRLLDLSTGSELARLPGGPAAIRFHSNGESLVISGAAGLQCWSMKSDPQTGGLHMRPPLSLGTSAGRTQRLLAEPTGLSLVGDTVAAVDVTRRQVLVFNVRNPDRELVLRADSLLYDVAISPDTRWVATSDWGRRGVRIWDAQNGEVVKDLPVAHNAVAFSPDGQWLVVGNEEEYAFWDVARWRLERRVARVESGDNRGRAVFRPDGKMLAIAHSSTLVKLVDPVSGREFATLPTTGGPVCFSPDGGQLVTSAENDGIRVWDLRLIRQQLAEMGLDWDLSSDRLPPREDARQPRASGAASVNEVHWFEEQTAGVSSVGRRALYTSGSNCSAANLSPASICCRICVTSGWHGCLAGSPCPLDTAFRAAIDADWQRSQDPGITGVPTFVVGNHGLVGAQPFEELEALVQAAGAVRRPP